MRGEGRWLLHLACLTVASLAVASPSLRRPDLDSDPVDRFDLEPEIENDAHLSRKHFKRKSHHHEYRDTFSKDITILDPKAKERDLEDEDDRNKLEKERIKPIMESESKHLDTKDRTEVNPDYEESVAALVADSSDASEDRVRERILRVDGAFDYDALVAGAAEGAEGAEGAGGRACVAPAHACVCADGGAELVCKHAGLREVPPLHSALLKLDLTGNNITTLRRTSFLHAQHLDELTLSENRLEAISAGAFEPVAALRRLSLARCGLRRMPTHALRPLTGLHYLQLDHNEMAELEGGSLLTLSSLRTLKLEGNRLRAVPTEALRALAHLELLNLGMNLLSELTGSSLPHLPTLRALSVKRNQITTIEDNAFSNATGIRVLQLDDNLLTDIPLAIHQLPHLQELSVNGNRIAYVGAGALQRCPELAQLELRGNPLVRVHPLAFAHLPALKQLVLSEARELREFPSLNGSGALETLRLDRAALTALPHDLCRSCPRLRTLDVKSNQITRMPDFSACRELRVLDLASNFISSLESRPFRGLARLHDLLLARNLLTSLPRDSFHGLSDLQVLDLEHNHIEYIHPDVFLPISKIEDLNLANNFFPHLPPSGLKRLLHLKTFNNPNLKHFHSPEVFPRIQTLVLSYAYHCCPFMPLMEAPPPAEEHPRLRETVIFPKSPQYELWSNNVTDIWPQYSNISKDLGSQLQGILDAFGTDFTYPANLPAYAEEYFDGDERIPGYVPPTTIQCLPLPGPFLPCVDLFDWWTLRCGVWVVFLLALLGNGTVVFVLVFSRSKMDVPRFLVCNLAAADFFMGVYLGFLAVVDASTLGEFRAHAIAWQMSGACRLAGFLGVLSSELSVYTLAVITLERNYAITHAMHLNKRLSLRHAAYVMAGGWGFSLLAATLPLLGISDYRKFAVCLPFETTGTPSLAYVALLMAINGLAFMVLLGCYLKMYCAIRGSQAWNSNDSRIAKRMALLVFTDFLCWSPIAFFALTAAFGVQLVSLEQAKVFTVFVLPLNSCCNPFLYAILTKQFKKDCALVCKAIEESRVTRGIGRCRHSSNFSNRQTPANTNSLVERSSRGQHAPHCACRARLLGSAEPPRKDGRARLGRWLAACGARRAPRAAQQAARAQPGPAPRTGSVSSSENFSSSRSDSWRAYTAHRAPPPPRRAASWLVARKTSQDSNLSSSRNDSSGSATTASTGTWRTSRSSGRPRLTRQLAVTDEPPPSPARLAVRFLHTIPSAAEPEPPPDDEPPPLDPPPPPTPTAPH